MTIYKIQVMKGYVVLSEYDYSNPFGKQNGRDTTRSICVTIPFGPGCACADKASACKLAQEIGAMLP